MPKNKPTAKQFWKKKIERKGPSTKDDEQEKRKKYIKLSTWQRSTHTEIGKSDIIAPLGRFRTQRFQATEWKIN